MFIASIAVNRGRVDFLQTDSGISMSVLNNFYTGRIIEDEREIR